MEHLFHVSYYMLVIFGTLTEKFKHSCHFSHSSVADRCSNFGFSAFYNLLCNNCPDGLSVQIMTQLVSDSFIVVPRL